MICETGIEWKRRVCQGGCAVHGDPRDCSGELQAHHVISQQNLRKHGLDAYRWDTDNGLPLCKRAHTRHDGAVERVPYELLREDNIRFAYDFGLDHLLDRYYPRHGMEVPE